jgi:hypothetical protein
MKWHSAPATRPMSTALKGCTKPAPWVTVASPATAPEMAPSALAFPLRTRSATIQETAPAAAAKCVATNALVASEDAASALPALKPNQPTHSRHAPMKLSTRLCGTIFSCG